MLGQLGGRLDDVANLGPRAGLEGAAVAALVHHHGSLAPADDLGRYEQAAEHGQNNDQADRQRSPLGLGYASLHVRTPCRT